MTKVFSVFYRKKTVEKGTIVKTVEQLGTARKLPYKVRPLETEGEG